MNSRVSRQRTPVREERSFKRPGATRMLFDAKVFRISFLHLFLHPHSSSSKMAEVVKKGKSPQDFASQYTFHCYISLLLTVLAMQLIS